MKKNRTQIPISPKHSRGIYSMKDGDEKQNGNNKMQCESQESLIDERETHNEETSEIIETIADVKVASKPDTPKPEEREEHEATHVGFRSWCRHCVRGG